MIASTRAKKVIAQMSSEKRLNVSPQVSPLARATQGLLVLFAVFVFCLCFGALFGLLVFCLDPIWRLYQKWYKLLFMCLLLVHQDHH